LNLEFPARQFQQAFSPGRIGSQDQERGFVHAQDSNTILPSTLFPYAVVQWTQ
jgi:hypothetical protein